MVFLRRVYRTEGENSLLTLPSSDPFTLWRNSNRRLSQTKLIPMSSLGLQDVHVRDPHSLNTLYINDKDAGLLKETIEKVRKDQSDAITPLTIAREIDHSIEEPNLYKVDDSGLLTQSQNGIMDFIPSYIAQGLKDLRQLLLKEGVRINLNIVTHNNYPLNKMYHLNTNSTRATILKVSLKNRKKPYSNKDVRSIQELKDFLIDALSDNPGAVSVIQNYDFNITKSLPKAQQARTINGILYYSMAPQANSAHKIGQLDFSFSDGKVNIVPTAAKKYNYQFNDGVLEEG